MDERKEGKGTERSVSNRFNELRSRARCFVDRWHWSPTIGRVFFTTSPVHEVNGTDEARGKGSRFPLFTIIVFPSRRLIYECRRLLLRHNLHARFATLYPIAQSGRGQPDTVSSFELQIFRIAIGFLVFPTNFRPRNVSIDKSINAGSVGEIRVSDGRSNRNGCGPVIVQMRMIMKRRSVSRPRSGTRRRNAVPGIVAEICADGDRGEVALTNALDPPIKRDFSNAIVFERK